MAARTKATIWLWGQAGEELARGEEQTAQEQGAQIAGQDHAQVRISQPHQHDHDRQGPGDDDEVVEKGGGVLAGHHLQRLQGQGQQQLHRPLGVLLRPGAHG